MKVHCIRERIVGWDDASDYYKYAFNGVKHFSCGRSNMPFPIQDAAEELSRLVAPQSTGKGKLLSDQRICCSVVQMRLHAENTWLS